MKKMLRMTGLLRLCTIWLVDTVPFLTVTLYASVHLLR